MRATLDPFPLALSPCLNAGRSSSQLTAPNSHKVLVPCLAAIRKASTVKFSSHPDLLSTRPRQGGLLPRTAAPSLSNSGERNHVSVIPSVEFSVGWPLEFVL